MLRRSGSCPNSRRARTVNHASIDIGFTYHSVPDAVTSSSAESLCVKRRLMWARGKNRRTASNVRWEGEVARLEGQKSLLCFNAQGIWQAQRSMCCRDSSMKSKLDDNYSERDGESIGNGRAENCGEECISTVAVCLAALRTYPRRRYSCDMKALCRSEKQQVGNRQSRIMQCC
jgi:hypothetical protein